MGFLTPSYGGELDYDTGTGNIALTWSAASINEDDIIVLAVEGQGGDSFTTPTGYALVQSRNTGSGTAHAKAVLYLRRADGTETGVTVADTGNHTSASAHVFRNIDRDTALTSFPTSGSIDTSADNEQRSTQVDGTTAGVVQGQSFHVFVFTAGADNHGGSTNSVSAGLFWDAASNDIRSGGHTAGSDGSHWTRQAKGTWISTTRQWIMGTGNSMREARTAVYLPAHEYTENTRAVSDSSTAADSIGRDVDFTRALVDALTSSEAVARLGAYTRSIVDSTGLSDAVARVQGWVRSISDAGTYSDAVGRVLGAVRSVADAGSFADVVTTDKMLFRLITEAITASDAVARGITKFRTVVESVTYSDSVTYLLAGIRAAVTVAVASLTNVVTSVSPLTYIQTLIRKEDNSTEIVTEVGSLTDIEPDVAPLTDIETEIE